MSTTQDAIEIIERMQTIVANDMLIRGCYIEPYVSNRKLADSGAICGGRRVCAIGSLWLASGENRFDVIEGALPYDRDDYMSDKPALRLAYDTLNESAREHELWNEFIEGELSYEDTCNVEQNAMEELFESTTIDPHELLTVVTENALAKLRK